jgi:hypothetical protein
LIQNCRETNFLTGSGNSDDDERRPNAQREQTAYDSSRQHNSRQQTADSSSRETAARRSSLKNDDGTAVTYM